MAILPRSTLLLVYQPFRRYSFVDKSKNNVFYSIPTHCQSKPFWDGTPGDSCLIASSPELNFYSSYTWSQLSYFQLTAFLQLDSSQQLPRLQQNKPSTTSRKVLLIT